MFEEQKEFIETVRKYKKKEYTVVHAMKNLYEYCKRVQKKLIEFDKNDIQKLEISLGEKYTVGNAYQMMICLKRFFKQAKRERVFEGIVIKKPWVKKGREKKELLREMEEYIKGKKGLKGSKHGFYELQEYLKERGISLFNLTARQAQDFQQYLTGLGKAGKSQRFKKKTVLHIISDLSEFYRHLKKEKQVFSNPFANIRRMRVAKELPKNIISEENMHDLLERLSIFYDKSILQEKKQGFKAHVIAELVYATGLTYSQMMSLKVKDIDLDRGTLSVKDRNCLLNEYALKILKLYMERLRKYYVKPNDERVFNAPVNTNVRFNKTVQAHCRALELPKLCLREIRNTYILHLIKGGCDLRYVQELSGHKELDATLRYLKAEKRELRNVLDIYHPRKEAGHEKL